MTDIDITAAIKAADYALRADNNAADNDSLDESWHREAEVAVTAALPHILAQVEARVKPSREGVAHAIWGCTDLHRAVLEDAREIADAVLALLPGKTEQEVRADMLDALIDRYLHGSRASHAMPDHVINWIRSQPEYKARYHEGGEQT